MIGDAESLAFKRDLGDGFARLARGSVHGESLLWPGGSLGICGERFPGLNWGDPVATVPFMLCRRDDVRLGAAGHECRRLAAADLPELGDVLAEAFECPVQLLRSMLGDGFLTTPDVAFFAASADGRVGAVAGAVRVGDTVGIFALGTRPELRRRGLGGAALSAAMEQHLERCPAAYVLQASDSGAPVYERLGFSTVARSELWGVAPE